MDGLLFAFPNAGWILKNKSELVDILWIAGGILSLSVFLVLSLYFVTFNPFFMVLSAILEVILVTYTSWIAGFSDDRWWLLLNAVSCLVAVILDPLLYNALGIPAEMDFYKSLIGNTAIFFFGLVGYYLGMIHAYEIKIGGVSVRDLIYLIPLMIVAGITVYLYSLATVI